MTRITDDMATQIFKVNRRLRDCQAATSEAKEALEIRRDAEADAAQALADLIDEAESGQQRLPLKVDEEGGAE